MIGFSMPPAHLSVALAIVATASIGCVAGVYAIVQQRRNGYTQPESPDRGTTEEDAPCADCGRYRTLYGPLNFDGEVVDVGDMVCKTCSKGRGADPSELAAGEENIVELAIGAWREALAMDGANRVLAVSMLVVMTVYVPALFVLMLLATFGVI